MIYKIGIFLLNSILILIGISILFIGAFLFVIAPCVIYLGYLYIGIIILFLSGCCFSGFWIWTNKFPI